jgi:germacradienol/geosmin synthase
MPVLFERHQLDEATRDALTRYADQLKDWLSGILQWHRSSSRYTESGLASRFGPPHPQPGRLPSRFFIAARPWQSGGAMVRYG